jgi:hypothetical protein
MSGRRKRWLLVGSALLLLLALDLARPPRDQLTGAALVAAIDAYQAVISPGLQSAGVRCRFQPSCSHYAQDAIRARGALVGSALTAWRLLRCGPWTPAGTVDPAPEMLD